MARWTAVWQPAQPKRLPDLLRSLWLLALLVGAIPSSLAAAETSSATTSDPTVGAVTRSVLDTHSQRQLQRVVFGSFATSQAAERWAQEVQRRLQLATEVLPSASQEEPRYRVVGLPMDAAVGAQVQQAAGAQHWSTWSYPVVASGPTPSEPTRATDPTLKEPVPSLEPKAKPKPMPVPTKAKDPTPGASLAKVNQPRVEQELDLDLALQSRSFADPGNQGQDRWHLSTSLRVQWQRSWMDGQRSITATPFLRVDSQDSERTHFDMRELFASAVGNSWELHVGARHVFWGVTEFHHLVDVINQTDLVENIDFEDKLGQPMIQLSLVRDWGILDLMLLTGFRERTFPGDDGRLRALLPINTDEATYASSAEDKRIDGAVRWSHNLAGLDIGLYHFSGTNRDPQLRVVALGGGEFELRPHYTTIDQTGLDAQVNWGDWAFKLEAISRSGDGERYAAANLGFERTYVGAFGSRSDLGLVLEYMFDERGEDATNSFLEQDLAAGMRWQFNDLYDSQALFGVIWDTRSDELVISLEAQRRLGQHWQLTLEGRAFAGADSPDEQAPISLLGDLSQKTASLQQDDYLQLELTRFF